jgi:hypothetical protein
MAAVQSNSPLSDTFAALNAQAQGKAIGSAVDQ